MQLDESTKRAIDRARSKIGAREVILFGSRARDEATGDSDIDLCFLFPAFHEDPLELMFQIRRTIHESSDESLDILVYEDAVFAAKADLGHSFEHHIRAEGVAV